MFKLKGTLRWPLPWSPLSFLQLPGGVCYLVPDSQCELHVFTVGKGTPLPLLHKHPAYFGPGSSLQPDPRALSQVPPKQGTAAAKVKCY